MMKSKMFAIGGVFLIFLALTSCVHTSVGETTGRVEFVLSTILPENRQSITTYKIMQPNVSIQSVSQLGTMLGLTGNAAVTDSGVIAMSNQDTQEILEVKMATGTIEYTCLSELFPLSPTLPGNDQAIIIATEFLKQIGLWHTDLIPEGVIPGGTSGGEISHLLVRFSRYIDGLALTGPGNKYAVRIGDQGKVVKVLVRYPEIEPDEQMQCIDASVALEKLRAGDALFALPADCEKVIILHVSFGYYLEDINTLQEILLPVYIFSGECINSAGAVIEPFTGWVGAAEK